MAAFHLIIYGRFWVITEVLGLRRMEPIWDFLHISPGSTFFFLSEL
jgi:hypothetical protein